MTGRFLAIEQRRRWRVGIAMLGICLSIPALALVVTACLQRLPAELVDHPPEQSVRVEDRDGNLLREVRSSTGAISRSVPLSSVPADLKRFCWSLRIAGSERIWASIQSPLHGPRFKP